MKVSKCVDCSLAMGRVDVWWQGPSALSSLYGVKICGREGKNVDPQARQYAETPGLLQG